MADELFFNGIDAVTGEYWTPEIDAQALSKLIQGQELDPKTTNELKQWYERLTQGHYGLKEGLDPKNLAESGWGVVFAFDENPAVIDALKPLLDWRKSQAGDYFKLYQAGDGYRPNDSKNAWLARHGAGPGPADPVNVPYYLLLVGSPEKIPYRFQTQVDVQYGVGRIFFDTVEEYANYANSVVEAEKQQIKLARKLAFFGSSNNDDPATNLSATQLVAPLMQTLQDNHDLTGWEYASFIKEQATKAQLGKLVGGAETPALLFTATHGMSFPNGHNLQLRRNGALLTQDWPGRRIWGNQEIKEDFYFSADDLSADNNLWGLISFFFACYGAGTPQLDEFAQQLLKKTRAEIAPRPFISRLPQKMLAHPKGGALAVLGHVERAWGYSFVWGKAGRQLAVFESTLRRLMEGHPVGSATEYFNQRYAELATVMSDELEEISFGKAADDLELSGMWTAHNDARNYVILGDPAVRMMVADDGKKPAKTRPVIELLPVLKASGVPVGQPSKAAPTSAAPATGKAAAKPAAAKSSDAKPAAGKPAAGKPAAGSFDAGAAGVKEITVTTPTDEAAAAMSETAGAQNFNIFSDAGDAIKKLAAQVSEFLSKAIDEAVTLKVQTYTSPNIGSVQIKDDVVSNAELHALTVIRINGNIIQVVPVDEDNQVDSTLWNLHLQSVQQAEQARAEMIKSAIAAASSLVGLGK